MSNSKRPNVQNVFPHRNIGLVPRSSARLPHVRRGLAYRIGQLIAATIILSAACLLITGIWWAIVTIWQGLAS